MTDHDALDQSAEPPRKPGAAYSLCYYLAFGSVYASHLLMELVPADSVVRHGLRDGAEAARHELARSRAEQELAESEMAFPPDEAIDTAGRA
jgi:hypothetical protein